MNSSKLAYRAEIDGLRAIAVVSVVLYHAQIVLFGKDWFEGGYIGVDIFFVISGYLITRIIFTELNLKGSFSLFNFYERRARRIIPVLFVVIFTSVPFAWQRLLPIDFVEYAESIVASLFFASNFLFYFSSTEYGADISLLKPFLHTWSLGVEEQFYLIFPVIAIFVFKYSRIHFLTIIVGLSLLSLQFSDLMETRNPDLNFYLPLSRFWEMAVGSMLAYRELNFKSSGVGILERILPMVGLYLVAYSILLFDGKTPHPGFNTLIPVAGVALIIGFASKDELVGKILGTKAFVWIGLLSYSAYLWHFPIFAFSRMGAFEATNSDKLGWIIATILLSIMSYFFVEKPFRKTVSRRYFLALLILCTSTLSAFSYYVIRSDGVPTADRLGFSVQLIETIARPSGYFSKDGKNNCIGGSVTVEGQEWCELGEKTAAAYETILLGDSHSRSATASVDMLLSEESRKALYFGTNGCPALLNFYAVRGAPHPNLQSKLCQDHVQAALKLAQDQSINSVFLVSRWDYYVDGSDSEDWQEVTNQTFNSLDKEQARTEYVAAVRRTYDAFSKAGVNLFVLLQIPHQNIKPKKVFEELLTQKSLDEKRQILEKLYQKSVKTDEHRERQLLANSAWKQLLADPDVKDDLILIDPTPVFCNENQCPIFDEQTSFYYDDDHASEKGFARLEGILREVLFK